MDTILLANRECLWIPLHPGCMQLLFFLGLFFVCVFIFPCFGRALISYLELGTSVLGLLNGFLLLNQGYASRKDEQKWFCASRDIVQPWRQPWSRGQAVSAAFLHSKATIPLQLKISWRTYFKTVKILFIFWLWATNFSICWWILSARVVFCVCLLVISYCHGPSTSIHCRMPCGLCSKVKLKTSPFWGYYFLIKA